MSAVSLSSWIPVTFDTDVEGTEVQASTVSAVGRMRAMTSNAHEVPMLLGADVSGGVTLTDDTFNGKKATMYSYLFNGKQTLEEDEVEDASGDAIGAYSIEWVNEMNISYDNASLGVTGARSSTETDYRPYNSVYYSVRHTNSDTGYTADTNYAAGAFTYETTSTCLKKLETGRFFNSSSTVFIAHPSLRDGMRNIKDQQDRPIFIEGQGGVTDDRLHKLPVFWSLGAIASTTFKRTVTGNPLLVAVNRRVLVYGPRIEPQARLIPASQNPDSLEHVLQHRARRGFVLTIPQAASVLEVNA